VYSNIALADDLNTVVGVTFSHDSETPGLGAEITTKKFQAPFIGKQILDENGQVVSIAIKKNADAAAMHEVDAITGGTMTSNGVDEMLRVDLMRYQKFIDANRAAACAEAESVAVENAIEEEVSHE
jgi:Na+-transporting NADH:ubiquinone oxidoreductase subunit C